MSDEVPSFSKLITIAIPVFERYQFFEDCLNSAINQTVFCEILVIDNCSSHTKFKDRIEKLGDNRISYYRNDVNLGMIGNWNKCLEIVNTKWVTILHDDDLLYPNFIECFKICEKSFPDICCIASDWVWNTSPAADINIVKTIDKLSIREFKTKEFNYNIYSPFPGIALNKERYDLKFIEENYPIADFDFWVRLSKCGQLIKHSMVQAYYRLDKAQTTSKVMDGIVKCSYTYRKNNIGFSSFFERLMFLATTSMSARAASDWYDVKVNLKDFVAKEDEFLITLMRYKIILYGVYVLKYAIYRFGLIFKYKQIF